jgi:iron complex outermembrane receptor protein
MSVNYSVTYSVRRALACGVLAACGAGTLVAHAQRATSATPQMSTQATTQTTTKRSNSAKTAVAKARTGKLAPAADAILLAQATPPLAAAAGGGPASPLQLQTVIVTGSLIARTSIETPNPVQVITSKDLIQSGYTDVSSVLKSISANGASTLSQSFAAAFAAGASGISLRGLTVGDTLVLIDGERTVPYPLLDDNQRSFVYLASLPFTAIQSVQVDKNGASAVYGSDAIAGVVNVILKKQYQGFNVSAEAGTSERGDATLEHVGFIGGKGDLESDGYNWYISGEVRHQDQILAAKRNGLWDSLDMTPFGGVWGTAGPNNGASTSLNPFFSYPQSTTGYMIDPATGSIVSYLPGCNAQKQALNECLAVDPDAQLQPATLRVNLLAKFTKELSRNWTFGLQASWFESSAEQPGGYANYATSSNPMNGVANLVFGPGLVFPGGQLAGIVPQSALNTPNIITIPTSNPMYPTSCNAATDPEKCSWFGSPLTFQYAFPEVGGLTTSTDAYTYRLLANLDGHVAGWDVHATGGAMYSKLDLKSGGQIAWQSLQKALNSGYVFGSSDGAELFAPTMETTPWSELDLLDVHGQHKLFELPGGPLELAVGVQYFKEAHDERAPPAVEAGLQGSNPVYVIGTQKDAAAFLELDGNPIKPLEIDAAERFDSYQGIGSAVTPQIGVKFTPIRQIALRGTFGKGFRAPSAAEGGQSGELFGAGTYQDNLTANHQPGGLCPNPVPAGMVAGPGDYATQCSFFVTGFQTSNPHLQNVKSTTYTLGAVLQPIREVDFSLDYYNIKVQNDIVSGFEAGGLDNFSGQVRSAPIITQYCPTTNVNGCTSSQLINQLTPIGPVLANIYPYVNSGFTHTSGLDLDLRAHYDAGRFGRLTAELTWTHEITYQLLAYDSSVGGPVLFELAGTHGPAGVSGDTGNPKDRGELQVSWSKGPLTISPSMMFVGHFSITDPSAGINTCSAGLGYVGRFLNGVTPQNQQFCTVGTFLETNLYGSYQMSSHLQVHASVTNLFNKTPPVDVSTYGGGTYFYPYDPALHQDGAVGRFFTAGFTYDF